MSVEYTQDDLEQDTEFARYRWEAQTGETESFDRWLAEVERAAAAKALEDMAERLYLDDDGGRRGVKWHSKSAASAVAHRRAMQMVRARAAEIRGAALAPVTEEGDGNGV